MTNHEEHDLPQRALARLEVVSFVVENDLLNAAIVGRAVFSVVAAAKNTNSHQ